MEAERVKIIITLKTLLTTLIARTMNKIGHMSYNTKLIMADSKWNLSGTNLHYLYPSWQILGTSTCLIKIPIGIKRYQLDLTYTTSKQLHKRKKEVKFFFLRCLIAS